MNDNNLKNLKDRTEEERNEIAHKGALASAKAKQEKKILKEEITKRLNCEDIEEIAINLIERAKHNSKDFEILRDTLGQKPRTDIGITNDIDMFYEWEEV